MKFRIDLKILFFLILFYFTNQLKMYILIMLFCFIHECGHMIVAKCLGFKIRSIDLMPFGFFMEICANINDYNKKILRSNMVELKKIFISIAGPLINLILAIIFININSEMSEIFVYSNLLIFIFNLIPIYPLDGGRVLKSIISIFKGRKRANVIANIVSNVAIIFITIVCSLLILYLKNIAILFIILYLWDMVYRENKRFKLLKKA